MRKKQEVVALCRFDSSTIVICTMVILLAIAIVGYFVVDVASEAKESANKAVEMA